MFPANTSTLPPGGIVDTVITEVTGNVSTLNSTVATLGIGGVFTGDGEDVSNYKSIGLFAVASHVSAVGGMQLQFSTDNVWADPLVINTKTFSLSAATPTFYNIPVEARYFRIVYTNGAVAQTYFRLQVIYHATMTKESTLRLSEDISGELAAQLGRSVIAGQINGEYRNVSLDAMTSVLPIMEFAHHEIHEGDSFSAYYTRTTAATNGHRSGLYIKTPADPKLCHLIVSFSSSAAASFSICEAPTIAANVGTHANIVYNRYRDSANPSGVFDNAAAPAVNRFTTLTEAEIAADGTWNTGTIIRTEPLEVGVGPKPAGGASRDIQEYILMANTAYVFLLTNTAAVANIHHILIDWYEHSTT